MNDAQIKDILCACTGLAGAAAGGIRVASERTAGDARYLFLEAEDKCSPRLIVVRAGGNGGGMRAVPYYRIEERPESQAVSFQLGRSLCNLAEVRELFGAFYSRCCMHHEPQAMPQRNPLESRLALWVHDCLTGDMDHRVSLNRRVLPGGATISFDFGLSFMKHFYPPFYGAALGIRDADVIDRSDFLLELLGRYAGQARMKEAEFMSQIASHYPSAVRTDLCRYYFRNFKTYFARRLYKGRFFDLLGNRALDRARLAPILAGRCPDLSCDGTGRELHRKLGSLPFKGMDLRGLDLSGADLRKGDLRCADLRDANLEGADLGKADLRGADLRGARLTRAKWAGAVAEPAS